jgi:hypothetical protein
MLAVMVAIGAEIINYTINEQLTPLLFLLQVIAHYTPFLLFIGKPEVYDWRAVLTILLSYLVYHKFDICKIKTIYQRPKDALSC